MLRPNFTQAKNYILQHKLLSLLTICVIGITLTLGLRHLSNQSPSKKAVMKPIVHTQAVSRRPLYKSINLFGQLKAKAQIDIVNKYAGIVDEINVDLGSKVQAGDILLVGGLGMGTAGAAIATVFAQMVSAAMALWMAGKKLPQRIGARRLRRWLEHLWAMVRTGIPLALQSVLFPVANSIVQAAVNTMGTDTIAAWGICDKLDMLIWLLADAMGPALTTYTAQNMGAGRWDRVCKGNRIGAAMSVAAVGAVSLGLYFLTGPLGGLFVPVQDAAAVVPQAVAFMRRMAPFFLFYALAESFSGACCGTGDTVRPMVLTLLSICLLRVLGILLVLPRQHTMECIIDIYISSWIAAGIGFLILWQWEKKRVQKM